MTIGASVGERERLRLFYGLPLPGDVADGLASWQEDAFRGARNVRRVPPSDLHVTLAFLGHRPRDELRDLVAVLRTAAEDGVRCELTILRYRETERVGMLVLDDHAGGAAGFQQRLSDGLERLGSYEPEHRRWLAHVTVARFRERPGLRPPLPGIGTISPSEAALYHSVLRPGGAQYEIVEAVPLGG